MLYHSTFHRTWSDSFSIPRYRRRYGFGFRETCVAIHKGIAAWGWASNLNRILYRLNPWPTSGTVRSLFQGFNRASKFAKIYWSVYLWPSTSRFLCWLTTKPRRERNEIRNAPLPTGQWLYALFVPGKENYRSWDSIEY